MSILIKYELKKILKNRLFIGVFVLVFIGVIAFAAYSTNQYKLGNYGSYAISDMQGEKLPEIFVSEKNIDEFRKKLIEFENRDEIYEEIDPEISGGSRVYFGRYDVNIHLLMWQLENGEITEKEMNEKLDSVHDALQIKKQYLPEYFKLYEPVKRYDSTVISIERNKANAKNEDNEYEKLRYLKYVELEESALKNGFTVGYDYGWANIFLTLSEVTGILLVLVIIFGVCNVFTGEYASTADAILLSTKNGRKKLVTAKIAASIIYSFLCFLVYILMTLIINFAFLGTEGANVGFSISNIDRLFGVTPTIFLGCVLLSLITLAISSIFTKQVTSIASSLIINILPLGVAMLTYISNIYIRQAVEAMPVNMVFGSYIMTNIFAYWNKELIDLRVLFIPVAVIVIVLCVPIIYTAYCRHQVKN